MTKNNDDDVFDLSKEMKDKGFKSPLEQSIKKSPYWVFFYQWDIVNLSHFEFVSPIEIALCLSAMRFPPIGKS